MGHVSCPAVLVECGFLSNPEEETLLRSADYQIRLAAVLAGGVPAGDLSACKRKGERQCEGQTMFYCTECGNELPKWAGQCPACKAWNTIVERPAETKRRAAAPASAGQGPARPKPMAEVETSRSCALPPA